MLPDHLRRMRAWVAEPHGIILVTGPTGSGKSTTLYGALEEINDGVRKLISVEDPVEYQVPNITQVQVHADIGLTFAAALRSILRQDPDVIMIGRYATWRRRRSPYSPRSPVTWCFRPCIPTMR